MQPPEPVKHYPKAQLSRATADDVPTSPSPRRRLAAIAGLITAAAIVGNLLGSSFLPGTPTGDSGMNEAAWQARADQFYQVTARAIAQPVTLDEVPVTERDAAIASLDISRDQKTELVRDVQTQTVRLVYLTLWDDRDQDGDVVRVSSRGLSQSVMLRNAPSQIVLAIREQDEITLTGAHDGGGGITVALQINGAALPLPRIAPGQGFALPVR